MLRIPARHCFFFFYAFASLLTFVFRSFSSVYFTSNARSPAKQAIRRQERITSITGVSLFITPKPPSPDKLALYAWSEGLREKHQEMMLPLRKAGPQVPAGSRGFRNMSVARPPRRGRRRVRKA